VRVKQGKEKKVIWKAVEGKPKAAAAAEAVRSATTQQRVLQVY